MGCVGYVQHVSHTPLIKSTQRLMPVYSGRHFPPSYCLTIRGSQSHLIHCALVPSVSPFQTVPRPVQPFCRAQMRDRHTDNTPRYRIICRNRPHEGCCTFSAAEIMLPDLWLRRRRLIDHAITRGSIDEFRRFQPLNSSCRYNTQTR